MNVSDDLIQQLQNVTQELGISIPHPVSNVSSHSSDFLTFRVNERLEKHVSFRPGPERPGVSDPGKAGSLRTLTEAELWRRGAMVSTSGQLESVDQQQHRRGTAGVRTFTILSKQRVAGSFPNAQLYFVYLVYLVHECQSDTNR